MRILTILLLLTISLSLYAQVKIAGHYRNYFGSRIQLNSDSTFKYTWSIDISGSWTKGTWAYMNDTVFLHMVSTYDTLSLTNNSLTIDSLILSTDEIPERLRPEQYIARGLPSGGQNMSSYPDKLFLKKGKLFTVYNGRLVVKKQKEFWTTKKWVPWYFKSVD